MSDSDSNFQVDHVAKSVEGQWRKWGKTYLVPIHKLLTCQVNLKFDTMFHEFASTFVPKIAFCTHRTWTLYSNLNGFNCNNQQKNGFFSGYYF